MSSFAGKVIAITGAASGIGYAAAEYLAARGARLSLTDVSAERLQDIAESIGSRIGQDNVLYHAADVRDSQAINRWIQVTIETLGHLDGAVNAAGVHPKESGVKPIWEVTDDDWQFAQDVNVQGMRNCIRAQLKWMVDAVKTCEKKTGSIVVIGSNSSIVGAAKLSAYITSKHAVVGLMRAAAADAASSNIRVNALCPGPTDTPMLRRATTEEGKVERLKSMIPLGRLGSVADLVGFIALLLSDESSFCTGGVFAVDGGLTMT